jgi:predicted O-linked N-acetylglucosamine transferase (SPINDLY family)
MFGFISHWCIGWLDRRGLQSIAAVLETRAALGGNVGAMHATAKRALHQGQHGVALKAIAPALQKQPQNAALWCTRGIAHRLALSYDEALADYEHAHRLDPTDVRTLGNMGEWHLARNAFAQALTWLDTALALDPNYYEVRVNRVAALTELRQLEQAHTEAERLVKDYPTRPEPYGNLGNVLFAEGKLKESIAQYQKAVEVRPDYAEAHFCLVALLGFSGKQELVVEYLERCIEEKGETSQRLTLLAVAQKECGNLEKAIALSRKVIQTYPDDLRGQVNLAGCLSDTGNPQQALEIYRALSAKDASQMPMASNVLFEMNYLPEFSREEVFQHHVAWAAKYETAIAVPVQFDNRSRDPQRKLKVGYVSADLCAHPVGFLLCNVLHMHNKEHFEFHCFSAGVKKDGITTDIAAAVNAWSDVVFETPQELAIRIREAQVDVLIDLSGHTGNHRLLGFALRPAPVQATWIGYFNTTGMSSMDYFITDPHTSPAGSGQQFSEHALHLPHTRFCFSEPDYAGDVAPPPMLANGFVTFGSFNRLPKLSPTVLDAWAQILLAVPRSRLILKAAALADEDVCQQFTDRFAQRGVEAARLDLRGTSAHREMFDEYGHMDIALDPFPFNGGMTTLEALWMGVPVVTLEGDTVVSRQTYSALANLDLAGELAFANVDAYVAGAIALATNPGRLAELRSQLRPRMSASPLRDAEQFTRDLEALYRRMWVAWCEGRKLESDVAQSV